MQGLFDRKRPDADAVRKVKALITERFDLPETTILAVAELRCHEPGCPPVETVVTARDTGGSTEDWRIAKPINEITAADIESLEARP
ncbi:MAG: hypothetical protein AAFO01_23310 [Pseudomonadota bacterium]